MGEIRRQTQGYENWVQYCSQNGCALKGRWKSKGKAEAQGEAQQAYQTTLNTVMDVLVIRKTYILLNRKCTISF